ncbi:metal-sensing transcriptional repressor [Secundilactobacillus hailunensis]|uniref:Metal-sensing transcriptional repressor n=1 Tax=Secundilactobacillus hailunensis TaxID=2559923 RepID=A0ABW1T6Q8_9LACO|nr:metal-sensing transcriptional repressor [Secundilactobacillus hailunensis]
MACDPKLINRLKRAEGQLRGVQTMMTECRDCADVITQLSAVEASVKRVMGMIIAENISQKMTEDPDEELKSSLKLIQKL